MKEDRKKRRVSLGEPFESRRVKRRVSNRYVPPITDEELAQRLREVRSFYRSLKRSCLERLCMHLRTTQRTKSAGLRGRSSRLFAHELRVLYATVLSILNGASGFR